MYLISILGVWGYVFSLFIPQSTRRSTWQIVGGQWCWVIGWYNDKLTIYPFEFLKPVGKKKNLFPYAFPKPLRLAICLMLCLPVNVDGWAVFWAFSELHRKLLLKGYSWVLRREARPESFQSQPLCILVTGFMVFKTSLWSHTKYHAGASGDGSWGWAELFKAGTVLMEEEDGLPSAQTQRAASLGCTPGEREYEVPGTERCWLMALALWKVGYTVRCSCAWGSYVCAEGPTVLSYVSFTLLTFRDT